jgi:DNA-binding NarL/FixJ family response regulator
MVRERPPSAPVRVLIADDDRRARDALRSLLSGVPGISVVGVAESAEAALQMANEQTPTVALVDLLLPEARDGLGLLEALTREGGVSAVAISIDGGLQDRARSAGAIEFVDKDSDPECFVAAVRAAAGRE